MIDRMEIDRRRRRRHCKAAFRTHKLVVRQSKTDTGMMMRSSWQCIIAATGLLLLLLPSLLLLLSELETVACEKCNLLSSLDKIDCHPEKGATKGECQRRGCCWLELRKNGTASSEDDEPSCFFPADFNCYNIKLAQDDETHGLDHDDEADKHLAGQWQQSGNGHSAAGKANGGTTSRGRRMAWLLERRFDCPASGFHDDARRLKLELSVYGRTIINIKISEPDRPNRHQPDLPELSLPTDDGDAIKETAAAGQKDGIYDFGNQSSNTDTDNDKKDGSSNDNPASFSLFVGGGGSGAAYEADELLRVELQWAEVGSPLRVIQQESGKILFQTHLQKLIYSEQFIQLPTWLGSPGLVYGLGQHQGGSLLKRQSKTYTMFNYGHPPQQDGRTAYSSYPFYINIASLPATAAAAGNKNNGSTHKAAGRAQMASGALMLNSNAMDVVLRSAAGSSSISWRLVGGVVNLFLFAGPEPHDVIGQYQSLVGRPALPPAWALGYHQSRLNYRQLLPIKEAWARTRSAGVPLESIWTDLDFLRNSASYTLNNPELGELVRVLQQQFGMHYVPIVDPTVSLLEDPANYEALKLAKSMNLLAYNSDGDGESSPALVSSWSERSGLLDFTHSDIVPYLQLVLQDYRQQVNFDGLWLDMNEPEVFANQLDCPNDQQLQYLPGNRKLNERTLCMETEFEAGRHKDLHNLYAFYQSRAHHQALKALNPTRRPLVISRAQFPGQGKYSGSWLGDLSSSFEHLRWSLLGTIESNWFGQPMIGADICGFFGSTSDELCARWFSLGAFYPLARNHNDGLSRDQDPGALGEDVQRAARVALMKRYSLLPFLYSLFYRNYLEGEPVVSSMVFSFFKQFNRMDLASLSREGSEDQLVWGRSLVVAPVLERGAVARSVHLPRGRWYDISIGLPGTDLSEGPFDALKSSWLTEDAAQQEDSRLQGRLASLRKPIDCNRSLSVEGCWLTDQFTPLGSVNIFLRGGSILPTFRRVSHTSSINQLWSEASFFPEVALDENGSATGILYWDDGESEPESGKYDEVSFWAERNRLTMTMVKDDYKERLRFDGFVVYGALLKEEPKTRVFRNVRLVYNYDRKRSTLTCVFKSISSDLDESLSLERYDNLHINW